MEETSQMDKHFAIQQTIMQWAMGHDSHDADMVAETFASDADAMGAVGRGAIGEVYRQAYENNASAQRRHVLTNYLVLEDGDDEVVVQHYLTLLIIRGKALELHNSGLYIDTMVPEDGTWKIKYRTTVLDSSTDPGDLPVNVPAGTYGGRPQN